MDEPKYDLALFERLNEEYSAKPLVRSPPGLDATTRMKRANRKLRQIAADVDLDGKRVLELGCAHGQMTRQLARKGGAREAIGVDVVPSPMWEEFRGKRVNFTAVDLASGDAFPPGSIDVVVSNSVLEHVRRPLAMLEAIARLLKVGGVAWLMFNLHRGPKASHRYREVFFPWPHLLFDAAVGAAFYRKHHDRDSTFAWVNRLTAAEYMEACLTAGFHVVRHERRVTPIDIPFYRRFIEKLGSYPALDLETDFLILVLKKRRLPARRSPTLGYLERQRELDAAIAERDS
jgi:2-polyprenyl-3-methyl-5-hydroxy-6-metoxy-1,4-benzoquinol methylase